MSDRRKELLECIDNDIKYVNLVDEMVFLEEQLRSLRKLPMLKVNPKNKMQQKATPAQKQYKEFLQQYTNIIKTLAKIGESDAEEDSPLRAYLKELGGKC